VKVSTVPIDSIKPYPGNPRQNADAVAKVAASLKEFGWRQPIVVDGKGVVVAGHTRLLAAQSLGMAQRCLSMSPGG
jgi:ParB-like chromosome segregation protein Spo0J